MWIYEFGIVVRDGQSPPDDFKAIATDELPIYSQTSMVLVDLAGDSLSERLARILRPDFAHKNVDWQDEKDSRYALRAAAYHLEMLAALYARHTERMEESARRRLERGGRLGVQTAHDDQRVFFEVDAFFESSRRFYEQLRRVLWKRYSPSAELHRPRSFQTTLRTAQVPKSLKAVLDESWDSYGSRLKDYRDSVSHNDPLNEGHTNVRGYPMMGTRWGLIVRLPENPEVKSRRAFRFESGPEALSYCHEVLCHLTEVGEKVGSEIGL